MTPLRQYYIRQAGGGGGGHGIGPIYSVPPFVQRGYVIGSFLRGLWRTVRPVLWSGAKILGREAMRTGRNIMSEIAANPGQARDILSTQNIIKKLQGVARKRKKASSHSHKAKRVKIAKRKSSKCKAPPETIKRDIFS